MSDNPYAAPEISEPVPSIDPHRRELADLGSRFAGALIDGFVMSLITLPLLFLLILPMFQVAPAEVGSLTYNPVYLIVGFIVGQLAFLAVQGYLLANRGQTLGKVVCKTKIVDTESGQNSLLLATVYETLFHLGFDI